MVKKIVILAAVFSSSVTEAKNLVSYEEITHAVSNGQGIRVVVNSNKCKSNFPLPTEIIGSYKPNSVMIVKNKYITFADLHFTAHHPVQQGLAAYESNKYKLNPDNSFSLLIEMLNPATFEPLGNNYEVNCELNEGVLFFTAG